MDWYLWILGSLLWYLAGWLPSRILKAYLFAELGAAISQATWNMFDCWCAMRAILGPIAGVTCAICLLVWHRKPGAPKLGWRW